MIKDVSWQWYITCTALPIMYVSGSKCSPICKRPDVYSATALFSGANWMERETYDFYGVNFVGHPNLKRILNVDEMDYFPMRKEVSAGRTNPCR